MQSAMWRRRSIHLPVTLSVVLMVLNVALMVLWIVLFAQLYYVSALAVGTVLFALILIGLVFYLILTIKEIRLNQRQINFVDSVTHELKSPIASLKLYVETLRLRPVDQSKRDEFYRFMLNDLQRLDRLINHLLEIGRLDAIVDDGEKQDVDMTVLLRQCAEAACAQYNQPITQVTFRTEPAIVAGVPAAMEMIFRNLLDNAIKYSLPEPQVEVDVELRGKDRVITRVSDNGIGVPPPIRNKIFKLFYRGGNELERKQKGTGLGLYIVHTLVKRMKGKVTISGRGNLDGTVFEVDLPGRAGICAS